MSDVSFDMSLVFSLTILMPLHSMMGMLFKSSKLEQSRQAEDVVTSVAASLNSCMTRVVRFLESDVHDASGDWFAMHSVRAGRAAFVDEQYRKYVRKELLRICGGFVMRMATPMAEPDVQLWVALESGDVPRDGHDHRSGADSSPGSR